MIPRRRTRVKELTRPAANHAGQFMRLAIDYLSPCSKAGIITVQKHMQEDEPCCDFPSIMAWAMILSWLTG